MTVTVRFANETAPLPSDWYSSVKVLAPGKTVR